MAGIRRVALLTGVTLGSVAVALLARLACDEALGDFAPFMFFVAAVAVSAWLGGWAAGGAATVIAVGAGNVFFTQPFGSLEIQTTAEAVQHVAFIAVGALISWLSDLRLRAVRRIQAHVRRLQALTLELTLTEQRERQALAQGLHDELQQLLVAIRFQLDRLRLRAGADHAPAVTAIDTLAHEAIQYTRSLTVQLSPPVLHSGDLAESLRWLGDQFEQRHGLRVTVQMQDDATSWLSEDGRVLVFQCVRELLFNVVKHAGVDHAEIRMVARPDDLEVTVSDRGAGYDPASRTGPAADGGFGLTSILERFEAVGGEVSIDTAPGRGVSTILRLSRTSFPRVAEAPP